MKIAESSEDQSNLDAVIARYLDSRDGYAHASELVSETDLSSAFMEISKRRGQVAKRLAAQVATDTEKAQEENGTLEGALHRWWMGIREGMSSQELHAILSECVRGEKVLADALKKSIERDKMKDEARTLMAEALHEVRTAIEHFKFSGVDP